MFQLHEIVIVICCGVYCSLLHERAQAMSQERGEQLRHQHQDDGGDTQRDGHLPGQEPTTPPLQGNVQHYSLFQADWTSLDTNFGG